MSEESEPLTSSDTKVHLEQIQAMSKELAGRLDKIHEEEFRKVIIQPIIVGVMLLLGITCYFYMPSGLLAVLFVSFLFSWSYPALQVVIWATLAMIVAKWYKSLIT